MSLHYRADTSDERVLKEVLERRCYRRASVNFDVEPGELWLDLGANIGAFAMYCRSRGARAECYEPDPDCFELLKKNAKEFSLHRCAVSGEPKLKTLPWHRAKKEGVHSRNSLLEAGSLKADGEVTNYFAGNFVKKTFDGVKMDIEGAEGPILDRWLLPRCSKLVLEYHTSRDASVENFFRRVNQIKKHFVNVAYPPEFDRASKLVTFKTFFDRLIFAWEAK